METERSGSVTGRIIRGDSPIGDEKDVLGLYADQLIVGDINGDGYKDIALNYALQKENSGGIRVFLNVP